MTRVLKRVPLKFSWEIGKVWKGYINPIKPNECADCEGTGYNASARALNEKWYNFGNAEYVDLPNGRRYDKKAWHNKQEDVDALFKAGRLREVIEHLNAQKGVDFFYDADKTQDIEQAESACPTIEQVNDYFINYSIFGHDSYNCYICVKARLAKQGKDTTCKYCAGEGSIYETAEAKQQAEAWEPIEPPTGDGFQLWGDEYPKSPVFKTLDALCQWCVTGATTFADHRATKEQWKSMLGEGMVHHKEGNFFFLG
jgi:hypothetical protein